MPWLCVRRDWGRAFVSSRRSAREAKRLIPDYVKLQAGNYRCRRVTYRDLLLIGIDRLDGDIIEVPPAAARWLLEALAEVRAA